MKITFSEKHSQESSRAIVKMFLVVFYNTHKFVSL